MTDTKYGYAFGRVRALEVGLIDSAQVKRMVDARTAEDAFKIVAETAYGAHLAETPSIPDVEKAVLEELKKTYEIMRKMSPERKVTDLFEVKYDIHNAKVLLKSEVAGDLSHLLISLGREGPDKIRAALKGDLKAVTPEMAALLVKARSLYAETKDFQKVEFFLDREYTRLLKEGFEKYPFLKKFLEFKVDLENIRNFFRAQKAKIDFEDVFLPGGNLTLKFFKEAREPDYFTEKTRNAPFASVVSEGVAHYHETGSLKLYEKLTGDFLMEYMKKAKYYAPSVEPVVGYLYAKEREASLVRQILISKLKGINVTDRVSEVYE